VEITMMPKGVEHFEEAPLVADNNQEEIPLMPQGVEHLSRMLSTMGSLMRR